MNVHERRDQAREASEHPWEEDVAEKPNIVMVVAPPDAAQPDRANAAADAAEDKSIDYNNPTR
jgi:hypothetical protein